MELLQVSLGQMLFYVGILITNIIWLVLVIDR
jgi:hypothetical protein